MLQRIPSTVLVALLALVAPPAQASILFGPAVRYQTLKSTDQTTFAGGTHDKSILAADGHLGILVEGTPLYIGGLYSFENSTTDADKLSGSSYGPTIGYFSGAFAVLGTYLMSAERTYTISNVQSKLSNGQGFRADVSYVAGLTGSMGVGPQITYRSVKFAKSQAGAAAIGDSTYEETSIDPALVFWFRF